MTKPRLRFAPSPTGYLHIGGVRTALFNWLWARKTGGTFILRIEDTDRERSTPENEQIIVRDLHWLGLGWDEGPDVGGPHGPYRQMERLALYAEFADKLVAAGAAYRCYCTKEELDAQRAALKERDPKAEFVYPGTCRDRKSPPSPDARWVLRMRAPSAGAVTYHDLVFGEVTTPNSALQDSVLMRSDGVPLYNLGAVVDDVTMGITLVARGRDHMVNTPIQILLYKALGHDPPRFAHLPLMLAQNGQKLGKRHGAVAAGEYRERGFAPGGVLNYLVRFGWSYGDEEVFSLPDLVKKFDWERCGKGDGRFDPKKFLATNFEHLKSPELMPTSEYVDGALPFLARRGLVAERARVAEVVPVVRPRAQTFEEAALAMDYFFREPPELDDKAAKKFLVKDKVPLLGELREVVAGAGDFTAPALQASVEAWLAAKGVELKEVAQPLRVALSGRTASAGLYEVMSLLGKQTSLDRIDRALELARASG